MAIIKCPECGHQTSDKAPVCPSCGVEIAGKINKCPYCGEIYFKSEAVCPHCHKAKPEENSLAIAEDTHSQDGSDVNHTSADGKTTQSANVQTEGQKDVQTNNGTHQETSERQTTYQENNGQKKSNRTILWVSVIIAAIVLGACFFMYNNANKNKEMDEYQIAMQSSDPMILQSYIDNFKDIAPQAHLDVIKERLDAIQKQDKDWTNAVVSGSKEALVQYMNEHPDSPHKQEALDKIDSIDWVQSSNLNTSEAYQMYIDNHADGNHYEEAVAAMKKIKANEVSLDEKTMISNLFRKFFVSINEKDESGLVSTVSEFVNFLGKTDATRNDIVSFMHKIYKDDVKSMVWGIVNDYKIQKREIGDEQYEYSVSFMVNQKIDKTDDTSSVNKYRISAKVNPDGEITEMSMTKIVD